ncbi:hypothetical protein JW949_03000 [Candidatus Woesearchaeota archaeon]|nr:hypothetical protein [Candidatus Woesearchaeota archaeon]
MEYLKDYLTRDGWKRDWYRTKQDFCNVYSNSRQELSDIVRSERGSIPVAMMFTTLGSSLSTIGMITENYYLLVGGILFCIAGLVDAIGTYNQTKKK